MDRSCFKSATETPSLPSHVTCQVDKNKNWYLRRATIWSKSKTKITQGFMWLRRRQPMVENQEEIVAHVIVVPESCLHDARPFSTLLQTLFICLKKKNICKSSIVPTAVINSLDDFSSLKAEATSNRTFIVKHYFPALLCNMSKNSWPILCSKLLYLGHKVKPLMI